ncbi:MAG: hypothetical protein JWN86_3102 [Planctomycetota bacterium]|nr:hypothetical protein [Planctomycetota bacterium]
MSDNALSMLAANVRRLQRENRRWRRAATVVLLMAVAAAFSGGLRPGMIVAQEASSVKDPGDPLAVYQQLRTAALEALDLVDKSVKLGAPGPDPAGRVAGWSFRLISADIYLITSNSAVRTSDPEIYLSWAKGPPDPRAVRAFSEHLARMKLWEDRFRPLARDRQFSALDFLEIQSRRIQAEGMLARELHRPKAD